ncbi:MAG: bifunctional enoyl-CoA hydratase/phosphate acetyltransferase [Betaproteobacteria bacterium]|nr:bifunctional enoyl-CoA hydratase/phosphate acetyltransferase [Betaproteobacteria bacterium]
MLVEERECATQRGQDLLSDRPHLCRLRDAARASGSLPVAVAYPCDATAVEGALAAWKEGFIEPILVGPRARVERIVGQFDIDSASLAIMDCADDPEAAAAAAVELCRRGTAAALMKGSLHTDALLGAALSREKGLRAGRRISHVFVLDIPSVPRPLLVTDCVVNISPGLQDKRDIVQNAIDFAHAIGIERPYVAILSAVETINPAIPGTLDAAALCKMADRKQIRGAVLDGPLAFDNAISERSAKNKDIQSPVAGRPDILIVPNLEAGNIIYKQLVYLAGAECAGIVLGTTVPIILTSRSDSVPSRVASCALAVIQARARQTNKRPV